MNIYQHLANKITKHTGQKVKPYNHTDIDTDFLMIQISSIKILECKIPTFEVTGAIHRNLGAQDLEWDLTLELLTLPINGIGNEVTIQETDRDFIRQSIYLNIELTKTEDEEGFYCVDEINTESQSIGKICVKKGDKS